MKTTLIALSLAVAAAVSAPVEAPGETRASSSTSDNGEQYLKMSRAADYAGDHISAQRYLRLAVPLLRQGAEHGDARAQCALGDLHDDGPGTPKDQQEQLRLKLQAVNNGDKDCEWSLALLYQDPPSRDLAQYKHWIFKAAEDGSVDAAMDVAESYDSRISDPPAFPDLGSSVDDAKAAYWYRKAALSGSPEKSWVGMAASSLADLYNKGLGVPQSLARANYWYLYSAELGDGYAQLQLGHAFENGNGVRKNPIVAHMWFNLAARGGSVTREKVEEAQEGKRRLEEVMSNKDIADAQELALKCFDGGFKNCGGIVLSPEREEYP